MTDFRSTRYFESFRDRCEELAHNRVDHDLILGQLKAVIDTMTPEARGEAAQWLWSEYLDTPPFDRVFALLTPKA